MQFMKYGYSQDVEDLRYEKLNSKYKESSVNPGEVIKRVIMMLCI